MRISVVAWRKPVHISGNYPQENHVFSARLLARTRPLVYHPQGGWQHADISFTPTEGYTMYQGVNGL